MPAPRAVGLDVVRALGALGVLVTHVAFATGAGNPGRTPGPLRLLLPRLDVGVSVFFVLSGLLVGRPFVRAWLDGGPSPAPGRYARRRLARVLPLYWFVLAFVLLAGPAPLPRLPELVADVLLVHPFVPRWAIGPISQSWTLTTELCFYLLVPVWFWLLRRLAARRDLDRPARLRLLLGGLALWVLVAWAWRAGVVTFTGRYEFGAPGVVDVRGALLTWLPGHLDTFAAGVGLAAWSVHRRPRTVPVPVRAGAYAVSGLALWAAAAWIGLTPAFSGFTGPQLLARHLLFLVVAVGAVAPSALVPSPTVPARAGTRRVAVVATGAALASYGVYLWHQWVTTEWFRLRGLREFLAPFPGTLAAVVIGSVALAAATYWLVERPAELLATGRHRPPATTPRRLGPVPALDGLRGLSILAVLATHVVFLDGGRDRWALPGGFLGVDVFLALSGFLIAAVLLREVDDSGTVDGTAFARRRGRRLYPPLVVFLVVEGLVAVLLVGTAAGEQGAQSIWALTFLSNWQLSFGHQPPYELVHLWSLALEGQFYVLMAVGVRAARRRVGRPDRLVAWCVLGAGAVVLWRLVLLRHAVALPALYERTDARLDSMLLGVAGALVWRSRLTSDRRLRQTGAAGLAVLVVCWVVARQDAGWLFRGGFTMVAAAAALMVAGVATGGGAVSRLGSWRPLRWVGTISFSLYLWHLPVYLWVVRWMPAAALWQKVLVAVPASVLAGWLGFVLVERRVLAPWRTTVAPGPVAESAGAAPPAA